MKRKLLGEVVMPNQPDLSNPDQMLRDKELGKLLGTHPVTLWRWARNGKMPRPIKISDGTARWRAGDVKKWLDAKQAG